MSLKNRYLNFEAHSLSEALFHVQIDARINDLVAVQRRFCHEDHGLIRAESDERGEDAGEEHAKRGTGPECEIQKEIEKGLQRIRNTERGRKGL